MGGRRLSLLVLVFTLFGAAMSARPTWANTFIGESTSSGTVPQGGTVKLHVDFGIHPGGPFCTDSTIGFNVDNSLTVVPSTAFLDVNIPATLVKTPQPDNTSNYTVDVGPFFPGNEATLDVTLMATQQATVGPHVIKTFFNCPMVFNVTDQKTVQVTSSAPPAPALSITTNGPFSVQAGNPLTFVEDVRNTDPSTTAISVQSQITLPPGATAGSLTVDNRNVFPVATTDPITGQAVITWVEGDVPPQKTVESKLIINFSPQTVPGTYTITESVKPGNGPAVVHLDTLTITGATPSGPHLKVTKTDDRISVPAGGNVTYTVEVTNDGDATARNVRFSDDFAGRLKVLGRVHELDARGRDKSLTAASVRRGVRVGSLDRGAKVQFKYNVRVDPETPPGPTPNTATVTADGGLSAKNSAFLEVTSFLPGTIGLSPEVLPAVGLANSPFREDVMVSATNFSATNPSAGLQIAVKAPPGFTPLEVLTENALTMPFTVNQDASGASIVTGTPKNVPIAGTLTCHFLFQAAPTLTPNVYQFDVSETSANGPMGSASAFFGLDDPNSLPEGTLVIGQPSAGTRIRIADGMTLVTPFEIHYSSDLLQDTTRIFTDGVANIITGAGPGSGPDVRIFNTQTAAPVAPGFHLVSATAVDTSGQVQEDPVPIIAVSAAVDVPTLFNNALATLASGQASGAFSPSGAALIRTELGAAQGGTGKAICARLRCALLLACCESITNRPGAATAGAALQQTILTLEQLDGCF